MTRNICGLEMILSCESSLGFLGSHFSIYLSLIQMQHGMNEVPKLCILSQCLLKCRDWGWPVCEFPSPHPRQWLMGSITLSLVSARNFFQGMLSQ